VLYDVASLYTSRQMTYDLHRLNRKWFIQRLPGTALTKPLHLFHPKGQDRSIKLDSFVNFQAGQAGLDNLAKR